jgi:hypothetical protein
LKAFFTADTAQIQETTITPLRYMREGVILKLATQPTPTSTSLHNEIKALVLSHPRLPIYRTGFGVD